MKKLLLALLGFLVISILFTGCSFKKKALETKPASPKSTSPGDSRPQQLLGKTRSFVTVYYQDVNEKYLLPVTLHIEPTDQAANVAIDKLLAGPDSEQVKPVIPRGTKLRELYLKDNTAYVSFTQEFLKAESNEEAQKAINSVVFTLTEFPMVKMVQLLVDGQVIKDYHGINLENALMRPDAVNGPAYEETVTVYYGNRNASLLVPYSAPVRNQDPLRSALQALLAGPPVKDLIPTIWPGTKILDIEVSGETVIVDLSKEVIGYGGGSTSENMLVDSLVATMTQFPGIDQVQLLVDGGKLTTLPEGTDVSKPLKHSFTNLLNQ